MPLDPTPPSVVVCINDRFNPTRPSCGNVGRRLADKLEEELSLREIPFPVERVHCLGECVLGPNLRIAPGGRFFHHATLAMIPEILAALEEQTRTKA
jgi:NADH:ubiquinone oxidoreductase subunit E